MIRNSSKLMATALPILAFVLTSSAAMGTGILALTGGVPSTGLATVGVKNGC
jgi:hypothetical protein